MLSVCSICNRTRHWFARPVGATAVASPLRTTR